MKLRLAFVAALTAMGLAWPLMSQQPAPERPLVPQAPAEETRELPLPTPFASPALDPQDLGAWLDGYMRSSLERGKIAGAVVSVVKDGQVILKKGYGHSDVAAKKPMDPDRTLVRIGSTSKLFTWTAVMQMAEQGKVDLDRDINAYLDFKIPQEFGRPITLNHLMTHRGGFEEGLKDVLVTDPAKFKTNGQYLKENRRPLMFPPGDVPAYSNYGTALAGYIVERVSGQPYDDYVERNIFAPLGMQQTTMRQPLPQPFRANMSKGYRTARDKPSPFELVTTAPAGSASATAADMANFMLAHLQQGRLGDAQILRPETARTMHSPSVAARPGFATMAHGFFLGTHNGRRTIGHGGDTVVFHTDLAMLPDENVGIFMSFNSRGENDSVYGVREDLLDAFMDRYFPAPAAAPTPPALPTAREHAQEIAGGYESSRRVESGFIGVFYLLQQQQVVANEDGTISLASSEKGERFREVAPYVWREIGGDAQLALTYVNGRKTLVSSNDPTSVLQAVPFARSSQLNLFVLLASLAILLLVLIAWPVRVVARRVYNQPRTLTGRSLLVSRLTKISVAAVFIYLIGWFLILQPILSSDLHFYGRDLDPWVRLAQIAMLVPIAAFLISLWNVFLASRERRGWRAIAVGVLTAAALLGVIWIAFVGSLMSFNLNY